MKLSLNQIRMLHSWQVRHDLKDLKHDGKPENPIRSFKRKMPDQVEAARQMRERQVTMERSVTSELMGDPLPGRSALDRKQCDAG